MPAHDHIILHPNDLIQILEVLKAKVHNSQVKIIDTHPTITIRDTDDLFIAEIKKTGIR